MEYVTILLMVVLTLIVLIAVAYRKAGASLSWYDEVASILLAWLTYYGSALAAMSRSHIGFDGFINYLSPPVRVPVFLLGEAVVIGFFFLMAWVGIQVLSILGGDTMVSLPWVPTRLTQSVIPIGGFLFVIAELLTFPKSFRQARSEKGFKGHEGVTIPETNDLSDNTTEGPKP